MCDATKVGTILCKHKDGSRKEAPCPISSIFTGGVDRSDQLHGGYHQCHFKSRKFLFGVAVTNSYILFLLNNPRKNKYRLHQKFSGGVVSPTNPIQGRRLAGVVDSTSHN